MKSSVPAAMLLVLTVIMLLAVPAMAEEKAEETDCLYYFYGEGCEGCLAAGEHLDQLERKYPSLRVERFEVYYDGDNSKLLDSYFTIHNIPKRSRSIPAVFLGNTYFIGGQSITALAEQSLLNNDYAECPPLSPAEIIGIVGAGEPHNPLETLTFSRVTGDALQQAFMPAGLALLLLLLALTIVEKDSDRMVRKMGLFAFGALLAFLIFGLGKFTFLTNPLITEVFYKIIGTTAVFTGILAIKHFFGTLKPVMKREVKEEMHKASLQPFHPVEHALLEKGGRTRAQKNLLKLVSVPGVFIIGLLVGFLSAGASTATLMMLRSLLERGIGKSLVMPMIFYYAFLLVIPMVVVIIAVFLIRKNYMQKAEKKEPHKIEAWKRHYLRLQDLVVGGIMLLLGVALIFV